MQTQCTIISSQDLTFNGRYKKCRKIIEELGFETQALQLCEFSSSLSHELQRDIHVIAPSPLASNPAVRPFSYRLQKSRAMRWIKSYRTSVLHAIDYVSLDVAVQAKSRFGGEVVFDACEFFGETTQVDASTKTYIQRLLTRCASDVDAVITPSQYLHDYYIDQYPDLPKPIIVNNAPVSPKDLKDSGGLRKALNVGDDETVLLFHGAFIPDRGLETIVKTAGELPNGVTLCLLGYGVLEDTLRTVAEQVNAAAGRNVVQILPPVPHEDLLTWIAGADFGLIPYKDASMNHRYCTPNKLYEYAAAGVPILASNLQSMRDYIVGNGIGKIIPSPFTAKGIMQTIDKLDQVQQETLKLRCREFTEIHSGTNSLDTLSNLYRSFL